MPIWLWHGKDSLRKDKRRMPLADTPTLSVIIPVYNENVTLRELLRRVLAVPIPKEIVLVDDCSTDGTREQLQALEKNTAPFIEQAAAPARFRFLYHEKNQGKGAAIRTGISAASGYLSLIQDADLEYNPQDYPKLIAPILNGDADVVFGSRFRGETVRVHYFWHALGNHALTLMYNIFTDLNLTDMETCYKVFKTEVIRSIPIRCNRFGFEPEITAKLAKLKCRIYEVPISYSGRGYDEGKKITWWDGVKALLTILRFWLIDDLYDQKSAGLRTLRIMEGAGDYNQWLFEQCRPSLGHRVLEVGSGVGNITKFLLDKDTLIATDFEESYVQELTHKFAHLRNVQVQRLDLVDRASVQSVQGKGPVDTILSMNVLEHIEDDRQALRHYFQILAPGGRLVILVPAHPTLYCAMDKNIDHYRRYTKHTLTDRLTEAGFRVTSVRYLNGLGALGWFINGRILRRQLVPSRQLRLFDWLMVFVKLEKWFSPPFGLSVLALAEKPQ
jgi:glycosyltransferase involved in cell wall biosynthesis